MKYVAMIKSGRVTSVWAESDDEAREQVTEQLSKPGRFSVLKSWIENGSIVMTEAEEMAQHRAARDNARPADSKFYGLTWDEQLFGKS